MSNAKPHIPVVQAIIEAATIQPRITHALAKLGCGDHGDTMRGFDDAIKHARELVTRLEIRQLEFAAASSPLPASKGEKAA